MARISKADVENFVIGRINDKRTKIADEIQQMVDMLRPLIHSHFNEHWGTIGDDSSTLIDKYQKWVSTSGVADTYQYYGPINMIHTIMGARDNLVKSKMINIRAAIDNGQAIPEPLGDIQEIKEAFGRIAMAVKVPKAKLGQVGILRDEAYGVLNSARSGKQAYDTFVALGFNMSGFKSASENLPSIIKLSVDPSILEEEE